MTALTLALVSLVLTHASASHQQVPPSRRMADRKEWTTRNLDVRIDPSYCYGDVDANCTRYGRLYTFDAASRACSSLGGGWRLPTDAEWRRLARAYGGVSADARDRGVAAYKALFEGGRSGFDAPLGGGRAQDGEYGRLEAHGFFWTASVAAPGSAVFYNFGRGQFALHRQTGGEVDRAFSVRCVRD